MSEFLEGLVFMTALLFGAILFAAVLLFSIVFVGNHISIEAQLARVEQLRADAAVVDPIQAEDVIGQVTETNQMIRTHQAYNRIPILGWATPDQWDEVEVIEVPR